MSQVRTILTENDRSHLQPYGEKITVTWTADGSGNYSELVENMRGFLVMLQTGPGGVAPTTYGVTLKAVVATSPFTALDELSGIASGTNTRSATLQEKLPLAGSGVSLLTYLSGNYTFAISGAGSGGQGICEFYIKNR